MSDTKAYRHGIEEITCFKRRNGMKKSVLFLLLLMVFSMLISCSFPPPAGVLNVPVSRDKYYPALQPAKYSEYKGQVIIFDSMEIVAPGVENFYYLNADKTVGYTLFYKSDGIQQPVVSFFWYALQKSFEHVGILVKDGIIKNANQLHIKILWLSDQKAIFNVSLLRNGYLLYQKDIGVFKPFPSTKDVAELQKRSFEYIDSIAETILNDPDFKREFFSEKARIR
jgi:hypothetical protein